MSALSLSTTNRISPCRTRVPSRIFQELMKASLVAPAVCEKLGIEMLVKAGEANKRDAQRLSAQTPEERLADPQLRNAKRGNAAEAAELVRKADARARR